MISKKLFDPRYGTNIELGMRVMIKEENSEKLELIPCYVEEIISNDAIVENGVKVVCKHAIKTDGPLCTGRVKYIGTESNFMNSWELISDLEKRLRDLIVAELSQDDLNWWENIIDEQIRNGVNDKIIKGKEERERLQIPEYPEIQELFFKNLLEIIISKGPWKKYFEKVFFDKNSILVKLTELSPYRNLPAHGKEITSHIEKKIQVYYDDIIYLLENYQRKEQ
jgi:hypothetical protein